MKDQGGVGIELRTWNLDQGLTVTEVDTGTYHAWHFLPFEDQRANLHALDDSTLLAEGRWPRDHAIAFWDLVGRHCLIAETHPLMTVWNDVNGNSWCYDPAERSLFVRGKFETERHVVDRSIDLREPTLRRHYGAVDPSELGHPTRAA